MKNTIVTFRQTKGTGKKLTVLTAYDYSAAKLIDSSGVDAILVGDSVGMVCLGYKDTLGVTMDDMIHHTKAVSRGVENALLIADMPFMSYQASVSEAVKNAGRFVQEAGAEAVKLEGGMEVCRQTKAIIRAQIPVMGHIGLTPQSINMFGGFKVQGKEEETARRLIEDAKRLEDAGVFSIVIECVPARLSELITEAVSIPTIGIGAGAGCDGQVLVYHDMIGIATRVKPKFVKVFDDIGDKMTEAFKQYVIEVREGKFPREDHTFNIDEEIINRLKTGFIHDF